VVNWDNVVKYYDNYAKKGVPVPIWLGLKASLWEFCSSHFE
jgi:hypothetical protein